MAVLCRLCARPASAGAAVVPALREPLHPAGTYLSRLPAPPLDSARAAFVYDGPARRAIHRLKFSGWRDVAAAMADAMAAVGPPAAADVVTWVPLARGRRAERGYDQARALAVALATGSTCRQRECCAAPWQPIRRRGAPGPSGGRPCGGLPGRASGAGPGPAGRRRADDRRHAGRGGRGATCRWRAGGPSRWRPRARCRAAPPCGRGRSAYPRVGSRSGLWLPGDVPR